MAKQPGGTIELFTFTMKSALIMQAMGFYRRLGELIPTLLTAIPDFVDALDRMSEDPATGAQILAVREQLLQMNVDLLPKKADLIDRFVYEIVTTRWVDAFEFYLSGIVLRALRQRPDSIGDMTLKVSDVLGADDKDALLLRFIEKKLRDVTISGLNGVAQFLKQFGVVVERTTDSYRTVREAIEVRHLIVHNQGRVDRRFKRHGLRLDIPVGAPFPLDWDWAHSLWPAFRDVSAQIDREFTQKFKMSAASDKEKASANVGASPIQAPC